MAVAMIRVFKAVMPNGDMAFARSFDNGSFAAYVSVQELAAGVKYALGRLFQAGAEQVNIDFTPEHDIVCLKDAEPYRCIPLSPHEKQFWQAFLDG